MTSVESKSIEYHRNFPQAPGVVTCIRDTGEYLKMSCHLYEAKDAFSNARVFEVGSLKLKRLSKFCAGRLPVLHQPSLYRALKQTYPVDVGGIVLDGRMTSEMDTRSLGQSVGVLAAADFHPVCV